MAVVASVCKGAVIGNEELMELGGSWRDVTQTLDPPTPDKLGAKRLPNKKIYHRYRGREQQSRGEVQKLDSLFLRVP